MKRTVETEDSEPAGRPLLVRVVTPVRKVIEGRYDMAVFPAVSGEAGILRMHAPYLAALGTGVLRLKVGEEVAERVFVSGGFAEVLDNEVTILAETSELAGEIDLDRAEKALARAEERLAGGGTGARDRARRAKERALARLRAAGRR